MIRKTALVVFTVFLFGAIPARADYDHDKGSHGRSRNKHCDDRHSVYHWNWGRYAPRGYNYYHTNWHRGRNYYGIGDRFGYGQFRRIREGIRDGRLSQAEVQELSNKAWSLRQEIRESRGDGWLTSGERQDIRSGYRDLSKDINHELNEGERRY